MQDPDIEDPLETHGHNSAKLASTYHISKPSASSYVSLADRGVNGGLAGTDICVLERTGRNVSVTGIDDHELPGLDIVTCVALIQTNHGKVNMHRHEYAYHGRGNTIHSPCQIEWFNNTCDDKSHHVGGKQVITFLGGFATPLECMSGLMYMNILGKPTDQDLDQYLHVHITSPHEWNPSVLDYAHPNTHGYPSSVPDPSARDQHDPRIDACGNIHSRVIHTLSIISDTPTTSIQRYDQQPTTTDYNKLKPYFGWVNADTNKKTFENSTQWAVTSTRFPMRKHFKSRFPAFNIEHRNEAVAIDTIFSDTPVIDSGVTMAQIIIGKDSLVSDMYPMHSSKQFVNTLEDNIRLRRAMSKLISDYAQVEISNKVRDILRMYHSRSWHSKPYHQNQNPS